MSKKLPDIEVTAVILHYYTHHKHVVATHFDQARVVQPWVRRFTEEGDEEMVQPTYEDAVNEQIDDLFTRQNGSGMILFPFMPVLEIRTRYSGETVPFNAEQVYLFVQVHHEGTDTWILVPVENQLCMFSTRFTKVNQREFYNVISARPWLWNPDHVDYVACDADDAVDIAVRETLFYWPGNRKHFARRNLRCQ